MVTSIKNWFELFWLHYLEGSDHQVINMCQNSWKTPFHALNHYSACIYNLRDARSGKMTHFKIKLQIQLLKTYDLNIFKLILIDKAGDKDLECITIFHSMAFSQTLALKNVGIIFASIETKALSLSLWKTMNKNI